MPMSLTALVGGVNPERTVLLLGAGASIPSGAPSAAELATRIWRTVTKTDPVSDDLAEVGALIERRYSRRVLVEELQSILRLLKPTGGLLAVPQFAWPNIYTTNFDQLIEIAYRRAGKNPSIVKSNFDFTSTEAAQGTKIYKIHGCITQDSSLGHRSNIIITEKDYEEYEKYRQTLFARLQLDMLTKDVLIIGQSLSDRHLRDLAIRAAKLKDQEGAPGKIYALVYQADDLRAPLLEDKGIRVAFGSIDDFIYALTSRPGALPPAQPSQHAHAAFSGLPPSLLPITTDISHAITMQPNIGRMFNGGAASYADIASGATFERTLITQAMDTLASNAMTAFAVTGAAGVGKTTFARQTVAELLNAGFAAWEHRPDFPLLSSEWLAVENDLKQYGLRGVLLVDECTHHLRQINLLIDNLASKENPALRLMLTANSAQWAGRLKSRNIFQKGKLLQLSILDDVEIDSLTNLVAYNDQIAALVEPRFRTMSRGQQRAELKRRCSADMFVCLKNIFNFESLDNIILREYNDLDDGAQEHYRYIAALEAIGTRVHRQLIIRMLGLPADKVSHILERLAGIVEEYDINDRDGIYGWSTRHLVIARIVSEYKFSKYDELLNLFEVVTDNLNPSVVVELRSVRDLCDSEFGIGRLERNDRARLYEKLIAIAPGERIPWHRLIKEQLDYGSLDETSHLIRKAEEAVGADSPIDRYKVRLLIARAKSTEGISSGDRLAILRKGYDQALANIEKHKNDKFSYTTLCDVAVKLVEYGESIYILDECIQKLRHAEEELLDPELTRKLRFYEDQRRRLG